jgi:hypothetical protein
MNIAILILFRIYFIVYCSFRATISQNTISSRQTLIFGSWCKTYYHAQDGIKDNVTDDKYQWRLRRVQFFIYRVI